mmetsp:Transcript_30486/g.116734  ORF Transcript_30486/g.116734 Transcript_30486/m.116734 type:complete len:96 (+) Transcript_30486:206-493(+)
MGRRAEWMLLADGLLGYLFTRYNLHSLSFVGQAGLETDRLEAENCSAKIWGSISSISRLMPVANPSSGWILVRACRQTERARDDADADHRISLQS